MKNPSAPKFRFRKLPGRIHQWHNHPLCPEWPASGFVEHEANPEKIDICPTCASMNELEDELAKAGPHKR
jgi:hypothetical protein